MYQIKPEKRCVIIVLLLLFICSAFKSYSQSEEFLISIGPGHISLKDALALIEQQTHYSVAYEQTGIDLERIRSLELRNVGIETALGSVLESTGYIYKIRGNHIIISNPKLDSVRVQTIKGRVTDESSGQPVPFANVRLSDNSDRGAVTDMEGYFIIHGVLVGRYDILVSCVGYEPYKIGEVSVTSAKETDLSIPLKEGIHLLNEIIVNPGMDKNATVNTMVLTGGRMLTVEEASRFAGGFDDPARLVSSFAGVSGGINSNALVIRGNSPQFTQWRMEGVEIPNPTHYADVTGLGGGLLTGLSSHVLGNSDFFNGAFPSEYTNALGGIFDMSMRTGNREKYEHTFQAGIWGLDLASEGPLSKKHRSSYLFNYRYSFSGISDAISGIDEGLDYQDLSFKINFPTSNAGTFTLWGVGLKDKIIQKNDDDPEKWEYVSDRQYHDNRFTKGMLGLGHKIYLQENIYLKSTLAANYSKVHAIVDQADEQLHYHRMADMKNSNTNVILTSYLHQKLNESHNNRTGFTLTRLSYDLDFNKSDKPALYEPIQQIAKGKDSDYALSAFTNSVFRLNNYLEGSIGLTGQYFSLNNDWSIEPRASIKWSIPKDQSISFAYGLTSTRERLDYYYIKTPETGDRLVNKNMDFSKAHHFSLAYTKKISDPVALKIEPYYQYLFHVPVEDGNSFSILNYNAYGLDKILVNKGKGRNYGVDLTLERYLKNGWYALITGSLFKSEYKGGDHIWRNTRMNQRFILHSLYGKEWTFGKYNHKLFSANIRLTYQGGYRYSPVDYDESGKNQSVETIDESAFSRRLPHTFTTDLTLRYRVNKKKTAHEFSFMILNATGFKQTGYVYNLAMDEVERKKSAPIIPAVSWKIYF